LKLQEKKGKKVIKVKAWRGEVREGEKGEQILIHLPIRISDWVNTVIRQT